MIIYEAYNDTTSVQFINEQEATGYANSNGMQVRSFESVIESTVVEPTQQDWLNLEQEFYQNQIIFAKALNSTGNGFAFLSKVFADGKTTFASENALLMAINFLTPSMSVPYTTEEIEYINEKFEENNFNIRL